MTVVKPIFSHELQRLPLRLPPKGKEGIAGADGMLDFDKEEELP